MLIEVGSPSVTVSNCHRMRDMCETGRNGIDVRRRQRHGRKWIGSIGSKRRRRMRGGHVGVSCQEKLLLLLVHVDLSILRCPYVQTCPCRSSVSRLNVSPRKITSSNFINKRKEKRANKRTSDLYSRLINCSIGNSHVVRASSQIILILLWILML